MSGSRYGVDHERGPVVEPPPHPESFDDLSILPEYAAAQSQPLVADLFCGAGGLSLGLDAAGMKTVIGVDYDEQALETYRSLFGGVALKRDLFDPDQIFEVASLIESAGVTAIVGGPPCQPFSRAGRATIRNLVAKGIRDPNDRRRDLWQSFLEIVDRLLPPAVIIENVPDMAFDDEGIILRLIIRDLEDAGYSVTPALLDAWRYGVPQHRRRLFIVALLGHRPFAFPEGSGDIVTVGAAIGDLPVIDGGWNEAERAGGFLPYSGPFTPFQKKAREGIHGADADRAYDHITRRVRDDDREAFSQMDADTSYADLDDHLKRYREDIFDDKYKRLDLDDVSRTIIAHIAKDGYGFIHPTQDRTISLREAARLQTFPDRVRFAGPPTAALRQIGNAVPPALAEQLGQAVLVALNSDAEPAITTTGLSERLDRWHRERGVRSYPWLASAAAWPAIVGEALLPRPDPTIVRSVWPLLEAFSTPQHVVDEPDAIEVIGKILGRDGGVIEDLLASAKLAAGEPGLLKSLNGLKSLPSLGESTARAVALASDDCDDDVVFTDRGVMRVVARFEGSQVDRTNTRSDGRVAAFRLIGADTGRNANLALTEIARSICMPGEPACQLCPLVQECRFAADNGRGGVQPALFGSKS